MLGFPHHLSALSANRVGSLLGFAYLEFFFHGDSLQKLGPLRCCPAIGPSLLLHFSRSLNLACFKVGKHFLGIGSL